MQGFVMVAEERKEGNQLIVMHINTHHDILQWNPILYNRIKFPFQNKEVSSSRNISYP